ncbi:hypothetical protein J23TS9_53580 [Paenibacillus sp. J23TS9]|uniref:hypothetical protein n=1 Tax=Paenibacillus sp. J23TS9 TaxID=2807193 RepID=UPI001B2A719C|nr:hypothetical protein [Paenibacillus sp. J23TS9]GIP30228.1 hypothetical protein J23TS9_53580 [Paenibacillus sp. J23TS9]
MIINGRIEKIIADGYERLIYIHVKNIQKKLWVHLIQHEEYLEGGEQSKFLNIGQSVTMDIGIDLVHDYSVVHILSEATGEFSQPIHESSHITAAATVRGIEDDYTLICDIENLGRNILVEFEEKIVVKKEDTLTIKGNLKAELC